MRYRLARRRAASRARRRAEDVQEIGRLTQQVNNLTQEVDRLNAKIEVHELQEELMANCYQAMLSRVQKTIATCEIEAKESQ